MRVIRAAPISGAVTVSVLAASALAACALAVLLVAGCTDESAMPATGGASDGSAETAVRLLAELTARREQMPGREVYVAACARCHDHAETFAHVANSRVVMPA